MRRASSGGRGRAHHAVPRRGALAPRPAAALLAALVAAAIGTPVSAEVTVQSSGSLFVESATDGQFDAPQPIDVFDQPSVDESQHAETKGGRADASLHATVHASPTGASATASGTTDIEHCCTADDRPQTGAGAGNGFSVSICSDQRATFTASLSGNVQASGDESTNVFASLCCDANGDSIDVEGEDSNLPRAIQLARSGVLHDGSEDSPSCVSLSIGGSSSLGSDQPTSATQWTMSLSVVETPVPPDADQFVWIGGASGSFSDPDNWSPQGGPPDASDTALFTQGRQATVDLASAGANSRGAAGAGVPRAPTPVERQLERTRVNLDPLRPDAGVLRLLSPALDDPSLVVNSGGRLLVDNGSVAAQSALVGEDGLGTVEVTGPNLFQTDGTLVLGRDGEGRLNVTGGGNALSNEVVMGDGSEPGNAVIGGNGSLWIANRVFVSKRQPSTVVVFAGGEVDTSEAVVDLAPQDELPNVSIDQSAKWLVDRLDVRGRGVVECTGGSIEPNDPNAVGEIVVGSSAPGVARLRVGNGGRVETNGDLVIGRGGDGEVSIDSSNLETNVRVDGTLRAGLRDLDLGNLTVLSSITSQTDNVIAGALEFLGGTFTLGHASRTHVTGAATIGRTPGGFVRLARLKVLGQGPPSVTRVQLDGDTRIGETGRVELENATLAIGGAFDVDAGGILRGSGSDNVVDAVNGILNQGTLEGRLRLAPGTNILSQSTGTVQLTQSAPPGVPQLSPLAASAFPRTVRKKKPPPPPPPDGLLEFEGDGEVAGNLVVQFRNGFAPRQGDAIELVKAGGTLGGSFANVEIRGLAPGAQFDTSAAGGTLTAVALNDTVALPTVSIVAKPALKEKKKAGLKVKVARDGDVSAPLLVSYAIGGTATNGVDYGLLPGTIEIPARKRTAKIAIRPRRDALVENPETIELALLPGPDYTPGLFSEVTIELTSADRVPEPKKARR